MVFFLVLAFLQNSVDAGTTFVVEERKLHVVDELVEEDAVLQDDLAFGHVWDVVLSADLRNLLNPFLNNVVRITLSKPLLELCLGLLFQVELVNNLGDFDFEVDGLVTLSQPLLHLLCDLIDFILEPRELVVVNLVNQVD